MNVYDTANKLASEIKTSEEYKKFKKAKQELESNNELKTKIDEFEKMRYEIQVLAMQGKEVEEEKRRKEEFLWSILLFYFY